MRLKIILAQRRRKDCLDVVVVGLSFLFLSVVVVVVAVVDVIFVRIVSILSLLRISAYSIS